MTHILFADTSHPKAYDFDDLVAQAMGGTESSLLRTAQILSKHGHAVSVFQQQRSASIEQQGIHFVGPDHLSNIQKPEHVIILRKFPQLIVWQQRFPQAGFHLWIHTYKNWEYVLKRLFGSQQPWQLITNSKTHANHCDQLLHQGFLGRLISLFKTKTSIKTCYNPIPAALTEYPAQTRDINKLLFLSAPNKGLDQVLQTFQKVNHHLKDLQLFIANPGYRKDYPKPNPNVHYLGALPAHDVKQHIATSLCVFYPQDTFAETFGLIYAEANALGTPVLAHDIGSAKEILHPNNVLIDANNMYEIIKTLVKWQEALPAVSYQDAFDEAAVYQQWREALDL
jgi:glycosyltransferase involved in cell wall biosynthesis